MVGTINIKSAEFTQNIKKYVHQYKSDNEGQITTSTDTGNLSLIHI